MIHEYCTSEVTREMFGRTARVIPGENLQKFLKISLEESRVAFSGEFLEDLLKNFM